MRMVNGNLFYGYFVGLLINVVFINQFLGRKLKYIIYIFKGEKLFDMFIQWNFDVIRYCISDRNRKLLNCIGSLV